MSRCIKIFQESSNTKEAGVAILISDNIDFKLKVVKKIKEGYYIMKKRSLHQESIAVNIYAPNTGAPNYLKQKLIDLKAEINSNIIIAGNFNTLLSTMEGHPV